jgi:hypothetical protein
VSGRHPWPPPKGFRPVTKQDMYEDIPLHGRPEFRGGVYESDRVESVVMDENFETKEIRQTPTTEIKDREVKSGVQAPTREHPGVVHYTNAEITPRRDESE